MPSPWRLCWMRLEERNGIRHNAWPLNGYEECSTNKLLFYRGNKDISSPITLSALHSIIKSWSNFQFQLFVRFLEKQSKKKNAVQLLFEIASPEISRRQNSCRPTNLPANSQAQHTNFGIIVEKVFSISLLPYITWLTVAVTFIFYSGMP